MTLERTVKLLEAGVESNMEIALLICSEALGWNVDVAVVIESIEIPNIRLEHLILRELS